MASLIDPENSGHDVDDVVSTEEDQGDIELDEVSSVDEDTVPRQKITINNKVCFLIAPTTSHSYLIVI